MGHGYQAVGWSPYKKRYDGVVGGALALYLAGFIAVLAVLLAVASRRATASSLKGV